MEKKKKRATVERKRAISLGGFEKGAQAVFRQLGKDFDRSPNNDHPIDSAMFLFADEAHEKIEAAPSRTASRRDHGAGFRRHDCQSLDCMADSIHVR